ncbi:MAG: ParB N-terminal domain-containing protein, partial [Dysosmobacter sp.]|nr:ParB N-terminal domain-containing protein [Dysosmobacter sp.]
MLVPISEIKVNAGRREADPEGVQELVDSISKVGLLNPITIDREHTLIAGLHRLEAAKLLGWTEIECNVSSLEGLLAELAEVDENVVRKGLSAVEYSDLLLRRKEIYETLHPETKAGTSQAAGMNRAKGNNVGCKMHPTSKSFVQDTAEKLGVNPSTIKRQIQTAKNLTTEAKDIIRDTGTKITKKDALKLSRLEPEQQRDAASQLAAGEIKSMGEYHPAPAEEPQPPEPPMPPS